MPKFFVKKENVFDGVAKIFGDDAYHIARSLRMAVGDEINISDGEGGEYLCRLEKIRDDECECKIIKSEESSTEPPLSITLCMAYPKGDKLEVVIQKSVELGTLRIIPFESSRCIKRPKAEKQEKQTARLNRIAEEAAKQCGRSRLPSVTPPMSYREMLDTVSECDLVLFCYEDEQAQTIKDELTSAHGIRSVAVIVGSEGGFSPEEAALAKEAGCKAVSLGRRILRCETAPSFALSAISYHTEL